MKSSLKFSNLTEQNQYLFAPKTYIKMWFDFSLNKLHAIFSYRTRWSMMMGISWHLGKTSPRFCRSYQWLSTLLLRFNYLCITIFEATSVLVERNCFPLGYFPRTNAPKTLSSWSGSKPLKYFCFISRKHSSFGLMEYPKIFPMSFNNPFHILVDTRISTIVLGSERHFLKKGLDSH